MKEYIKKLFREAIDKIIKCKKCGWTWKKSESGPDMYFCHKCGHDNTPDNIKESTKQNKVAGVLIKCEETNKVLLLLRNDKNPTWSLVSGGMENDEDPIECLKREIEEELSINPNLIRLKKIKVENFDDKNMEFHYYEGLTSKNFSPKLNSENTDWGWFSEDELPTPLYNGMKEKIKSIYDSK